MGGEPFFSSHPARVVPHLGSHECRLARRSILARAFRRPPSPPAASAQPDRVFSVPRQPHTAGSEERLTKATPSLVRADADADAARETEKTGFTEILTARGRKEVSVHYSVKVERYAHERRACCVDTTADRRTTSARRDLSLMISRRPGMSTNRGKRRKLPRQKFETPSAKRPKLQLL